MNLYLDTEDYNEQDIDDLGTYEYARTCEVMLVTYAIDDGPVKCWDRTVTDYAPDDLAFAVEAASAGEGAITAHNAMFDRNVLKYALGLDIPIEQWRCTMVKALAHGFPGSLDEVGAILGLPEDQAKLKDGRKLIQRFCKPAPSNHKADRYTRHTHPQEWQRFVEYAMQDITAMRHIDRLLPNWNYREKELDLWHLDQRINDRGFYTDRDLIAAGARAATVERARLTEEFAAITGGLTPASRAKYLAWLQANGLPEIDNTRKDTLALHLGRKDLPENVITAMTLSLQANKTSTAKYAAIAPAVNSDGRFRGGLQYDGAPRTRRWAGRKYQPQNLPSRGLPPVAAVEQYVSALEAGVHELVFDDLMTYGAAALRHVIIAPPGRKLICVDKSNIEGRMLAYLAGEEWKLQAFRDYDAGTGPDLYNITAVSIIGGDPYAVAKSDRNVFGKVPDLACGYEGGVGAFQTFAKAYQVDMGDHWGTIQGNVAPEFLERARDNWESWGSESGISEQTWLASEAVKLAWRARHPATVSLWYALKDAAIAALANPGGMYAAGPHLRFRVVTHKGFKYLLLALPSGRYICYFDPRVEGKGRDTKISYMGLSVDNGRRLWRRIGTYGGKFAENACQSLSRDNLADDMPRIEQAGYQIVLTVHDEVVAEVPDSPEFNATTLEQIMSTPPAWAKSLPLAAEGFECYHYQK